MKFSEIGKVKTITIEADDWRQMRVQGTSSSEYFYPSRNYLFGDIVISDDGISFYDNDSLLVKHENSQSGGRINFAERIRKAFEETVEADKELFDEHDGALDKFLEVFAESKEQK